MISTDDLSAVRLLEQFGADSGHKSYAIGAFNEKHPGTPAVRAAAAGHVKLYLIDMLMTVSLTHEGFAEMIIMGAMRPCTFLPPV